MNKFKFGDRVNVLYPRWKNADEVGVVIGSSNGLNNIQFENGGYAGLVPDKFITPATDWVKCSERMPEIDDVKSPCTEYFVATTSNDGNEVQRAYYIDWSSNERKWVSMNGVPIKAKVTHWMPSYTPAPPQD